MATFAPNTLYYGDNLHVLRDFPDECVDLVYLDPPFNSARSYNVLFKESKGSEAEAQIEAFGDTWTWGPHADEALEEMASSGLEVGRLLQAFVQALGKNDVTAYLSMMAPRLVELRRVMKPTASIYLHCDPTASHYLKVLMDAVFGPENFQREIIWQRSRAHGGPTNWHRIHDVVLYFSASSRRIWNAQFSTHDDSYVDSHYRLRDEGGPYQLVVAHGAGSGPPGRFGEQELAPPPDDTGRGVRTRSTATWPRAGSSSQGQECRGSRDTSVTRRDVR